MAIPHDTQSEQQITEDTQLDNNESRATTKDLPRRQFLGTSAKLVAGGALAGWIPAFRITPAEAATCAALPNFPSGISVYQQAFENWSREIKVDAVWTCAPNTPAAVVTICNWARANGYKVRPRGCMHNWAPFTVPNGVSCPKMILVDTTQFLTAISINTSSSPKKVTVQTGALLENVMAALEAQSLGFTASPAVGKITMGGALAINAHGAAVRANGETPISGKTYGSLSNLVLSITAVVWNAANSQYQLRTFQRNEPGCTALLTNLGRSFITDVTLQVGTNVRLRCQSWFDKTADELFAPAGSSGNTFSSYLTRTGRVEAIYFPYTTKPWLKVWSVAPYKPILSREVTRPYNYPFSDSLGQELVDLQAAILAGDWSKAPDFCNLQYNVVAAGLITTNSWDLWGWSKNTLLYIKPTTLRAAELGYAILCRRADVQRVLNEFYVAYKNKVAAYQAQGRYPMNAPVELRVCGLDNPNEVVGVSGAPSPQLSTLRPRPDHPEWDCAVWLNMLTIPGTPYSTNFYREMEQWILSNYSSYAGVRVEWSKGWAYTNAAGWADSAIISSTIPNSLRAGYPTGDNFDTARTTLNQFDPARIFSSPLIDAVLP